MVMAAAALCLTVAGAAACTIGAFFVSQEGCGPGAAAAGAGAGEGREGLVHIPLHHRRSSSSFGSSPTMPPPPSPGAASDREVPPDVQQRLLRLRRRVQRAELQRQQQGQQRKQQRAKSWRRLAAVSPSCVHTTSEPPPPGARPAARGIGMAAVAMLLRARARRQEQNHHSQQQQAQQPSTTTAAAADRSSKAVSTMMGHLPRLLQQQHQQQQATTTMTGTSKDGTTTNSSGLSHLTVAVFASRRAVVASLLAGPRAAEYLTSVDACGRSAVWWACRWGEVYILRHLLSAGGDERLPDHHGVTPREAARMGPYPRLCLTLLKEAERVNFLHKARGLLEAEDMLRAAAAAAAATPASVSDGKEGEEGACGESAAITTEAAAESLASLPRVVLRPVPLPALCWWIPGGKGSSISNSSSLGGAVQQRQLNTRRRAVMGPVPRDVRAGVLEMVVGKGLSDDLFQELRAVML